MNYIFILTDAIYLVNILEEAFDYFFAEHDLITFLWIKMGKTIEKEVSKML